MNRIAIIVVALAACKAKTEDCPPPAPVVAAALGTQADLAKELDKAEHDGSWSNIKHRWQGGHVTWTVTRQRPLCPTADRCNVLPFPIGGGAKYGWMPQLTFAPSEFAKLEASCGESDRCELTFQGTLSELMVSPDLPTSLRFTDVRIVSARG
jgi:hypothetical protein